MLIETILGGITGFVGNIVTSVANYRMQKLKNEHSREMAKLELDKMDKEKEFMLAEVEANLRITEVQTEAQMDITDSQAFADSIKAAEKDALSETIQEKLIAKGGFATGVGVFISLLFGLVDFLKKLIRPSLTIYLVGLTTWITIIAWEVMETKNAEFTTEQAKDIFDQVTTIVIYLTVTCVTWWFGDRRMAKFLIRLDDGNKKSQSTPAPK